MYDDPALRFSEEEAMGFLGELMPEGFAGPDVLAELDESYRESAEAAAQGAPPPIVQSYRRVYGRLPSGWPPA